MDDSISRTTEELPNTYVFVQVAMELSDLAEGKETIQLASTGQKGENPVRRILDVMLAPEDPR